MLKQTLFIVVWLLMVFGPAAWARDLPIDPITPDVKDKIKESVRLIGDVDDKVAPKVKDMVKIFKLYEPCLKAEGDKGCAHLKEQVGAKYQAVLEAIGDALPQMKKSINATIKGLGASIVRQTRTRDIKQLYEDVSRKAASPTILGPLSKKLTGLLNTVDGTTNYSILEMSLQIQADLIAASEALAFLESKVSQLSIMVELGQDLPIMNEEMASVMKGMGEIFGYDMDFVTDIPIEEPKTGDNGYGWH